MILKLDKAHDLQNFFDPIGVSRDQKVTIQNFQKYCNMHLHDVSIDVFGIDESPWTK